MLTFTDKARDMVLSFIGQSEGELEALRVTVGGSPLAPEYGLTLVSKDERDDDERSFDGGGFTVLVPESSAERLDGATVDFVERVNESGFEVRPPTAPTAPEKPAVEPPQGPVADRVREVLDQQVNPAIAAHGGAIDLVDVDGTEVYLEMSGGCQGCAMSRMTLQQGVERMLKQAVPEITEIHDVTDHESGSNPYFSQPV